MKSRMLSRHDGVYYELAREVLAQAMRLRHDHIIRWIKDEYRFMPLQLTYLGVQFGDEELFGTGFEMDMMEHIDREVYFYGIVIERYGSVKILEKLCDRL